MSKRARCPRCSKDFPVEKSQHVCLSTDLSVERARKAARKSKARAGAKRSKATGRRVGAPIGSWVTDLAELKQTLVLCWQCDPKWKRVSKRYGYEPVKKWSDQYGGAVAPCDGCREFGPQRTCYVHGTNWAAVV